VLALDDPRWRDLAHRNWADGAPAGDSDAPFVPDVLARLYEAPRDSALFSEMWPYLCSEGTTYAAAYAAIPHLVRIAASLDPESRADYLIVIGLAVTYATPEAGNDNALQEYLRPSFDRAKREALPLLLEALEVAEDEETVRYLLVGAAALLGHPRLGAAVESLDPDE
jgi:hypothetical protein